MVNLFNVMTMVGSSGVPTEKPRYFIDCPVDVEMHDAELRRIEIPRELAVYLNDIRRENEELKDKLRKCTC